MTDPVSSQTFTRLSGLLESAAPFMTFLAVVFVVFAGWKMLHKRIGESVILTGLGVACVSIGPLTSSFVSSGDPVASEAQPTPTPSATPAPSPSVIPEAAPAVPARSADFSWLPAAILTVVVAALVLLLVIAAVHYYRVSLGPALTRKRAEKRLVERLVEDGRKILKEVLLESASYETDLAKQIDYPMMTDVSEPLVHRYIRELRSVQELERMLTADARVDEAKVFNEAAIHLQVSFTAAVARAEKVKWSSFSVEEKRRLRDARVALDLIQDASTTVEQRNAQYRRITKLLEGLIVITAPVQQALGAWVPMLALEANVDATAAGSVRARS